MIYCIISHFYFKHYLQDLISKHTHDYALSTLSTNPNSFTTRQKALIESLMRNYLFIFYKHLLLAFRFPLQFSSLGLRLWHCQSVGVSPQKAWKLRCQDEERLLSHISRCIMWNAGSVWVVEAATHNTHYNTTKGQLSLSPSNALVCWCIVIRKLLILPIGAWSFFCRKTFLMTWFEKNSVCALQRLPVHYCLHLTTSQT